jgi:hypothetical protein
VSDAAPRGSFVHEATLLLSADADHNAPGAAVTAQLCGHWEHEGVCRWPHHTAVDRRDGDELTLRIVVIADPADEDEVRERVRAGLRRDSLEVGVRTTTWTVLADAPAALRAGELALAERLASTSG